MTDAGMCSVLRCCVETIGEAIGVSKKTFTEILEVGQKGWTAELPGRNPFPHTLHSDRDGRQVKERVVASD